MQKAWTDNAWEGYLYWQAELSTRLKAGRHPHFHFSLPCPLLFGSQAFFQYFFKSANIDAD